MWSGEGVSLSLPLSVSDHQLTTIAVNEMKVDRTHTNTHIYTRRADDLGAAKCRFCGPKLEVLTIGIGRKTTHLSIFLYNILILQTWADVAILVVMVFWCGRSMGALERGSNNDAG